MGWALVIYCMIPMASPPVVPHGLIPITHMLYYTLHIYGSISIETYGSTLIYYLRFSSLVNVSSLGSALQMSLYWLIGSCPTVSL